MVPVPNAWIVELYEDTPDPFDQYDAAMYALSLPRLWNRGKVEIYAKDYCNDIRRRVQTDEAAAVLP